MGGLQMVCSNSAVREGMTKESAVNIKRSGDDHTDAKNLLWCQNQLDLYQSVETIEKIKLY